MVYWRSQGQQVTDPRILASSMEAVTHCRRVEQVVQLQMAFTKSCTFCWLLQLHRYELQILSSPSLLL